MSTSFNITNPIPLDTLISALVKNHEGPLAQLSGAMLVAEHLGEVSDHLIGHFVDQARRSGASWSEIGQSMGVTKQAAQKRFVDKAGGEAPDLDASQGFSRFDEDARKAVMMSQKAAHDGANAMIAPEHLLLGLMELPESLAVRGLAAQGIAAGGVRDAAAARLAPSDGAAPELVPFDADARKVLKLSFREALRLGHNHVGTEHLLLALLENENGAGTLAGAGVDRGALEDFVTAEIARESAVHGHAAGERA